jgi:hypothetical protein
VKRTRPAATAATLLIGAFALGACSTTIDPTVTTLPAGGTTTTVFVATGTTSELLDQLVETATGLSEAIVDNEGQRDIMARIDTLWEAVRPGVEDAVPDTILEFDRAIALMHNGVDRRRPADADKALNNFRNLVAALPPRAD